MAENVTFELFKRTNYLSLKTWKSYNTIARHDISI